ncbi:uncharacterized protein LOC110695432 [Chenopodium quinoa]|uniref:uncharacterized protein LOC110695432 n=1 Tax=Chenopodium quinoa TaxID=63459 RepID=UPI000B76DB8C|nr:uncharacterized protein LOC110695432 [Chenopodium quinoa]
MGGGSRVGGGGKSSVGGWLSRSRLFRALKLGGPGYYHHDMLKQVAVLRGLSSVEELLASLGKQESGMSIQEELAFLNKELGTTTVTRWFVAQSYSGNKGRKRCEDLFKTYMKEVKEYGEPCISTVSHLTKYCGYELKDCKEEKL